MKVGKERRQLIEESLLEQLEMKANTEELDMDNVIEMEVDEDGTHKPKTKEAQQAKMDGPGF
jgi:hypothetical protein